MTLRTRTMIALVGALTIGGIGAWFVTASVVAAPVTVTVPAPDLTLAASEGYAPGPWGFQSVVQRALPAVVSISTTRSVTVEPSPFPFSSNDLFGDFFGFGRGFESPAERESRGLGSGVVVSPDGYILTNEHVVRDADEIRVSFDDRRELEATLVGADPKTDVAVLKVEGEHLPSLLLGDSTGVQVGDIVLAMGNPFGIGPTVTMGIVSATGRDGLNPAAYEDFIQTDAAINPGNSGGPLVSVDGYVVGLNTAIISRSGGSQGIGFAVPSGMARDVMEQIIRNGRVVRGWLGVSIQPVTSSVADVFELEEPRGALVGSVEPGSPAADAGLAIGDVIVGVDGDEVIEASDLRLRIAQAGPETNVTLDVVRDGEPLAMPVTLGELPETDEASPLTPRGRGALEGVQVQELGRALIQQLDLPVGTQGVVVTDVAPSSAAAQAGLRRGDVIQELNRQPVRDVADFRAVARNSDSAVVALINRQGQTQYVVID